MPTKGDIKRLLKEKGFVSVSILVEEFDITPIRACEIIKACWDKGLLLPTDKSWFALPVNGGPKKFEPGQGVKIREAWYRDELKSLRGDWDADENLALTVYDASLRHPDFEMNKLRKALNLMAETGEVLKLESEHGGAFGRKPFVYGLSVDAIAARESMLEGEARDRKRARLAKSKATRDANKPKEAMENLIRKAEDRRRYQDGGGDFVNEY